jgi:hypothetical protein
MGQLGELAYDLTGDQIARDHALRDLRNPHISGSSDGRRHPGPHFWSHEG